MLAAYRDVHNILPYLDLPLQHSHPDVLKAMNRPWQANLNQKLLEQIRSELPNAIMRTSLIVGFPGETKEHFFHLKEFIKRERFDHVGVFLFSSEDGTTAKDLPNQIPKEVAESRRDELIAIQQNISYERNKSWIGRIVDVLIEKNIPETGQIIGRCSRFSPEIDGVVIMESKSIPKGLQINPGDMIPVEITGADIYDLVGNITDTKKMVDSIRKAKY